MASKSTHAQNPPKINIIGKPISIQSAGYINLDIGYTIHCDNLNSNSLYRSRSFSSFIRLYFMEQIAFDSEIQKSAIIHLINSSDKTAFAALYRIYWDRLLLFASRYLNDKHSCEEIVQDLFVQLHINKLPPTLKSSVSSYLYSAVRNRIFNHMRNRSVYKRHINIASKVSSISQNNVEQLLRFKELQAIIDQVLAGLPHRYREAYLLRQTEHYPLKKIASTLNRPVPTVEKQIRKVHGILRERLSLYRSLD
jgi:RNA polymerase sigma-70 factor (ECF subfamily)